MPGWRVVWLAPTPRSSGGRSAVRISSGTPAWWASSAAGRRFAAAVPEVQTTATGQPRLPRQAEGGEAGDPLVDAHMQADVAAGLQPGGHERERLRARAGAQDDVPEAERDELAQQGGCGIRRG